LLHGRALADDSRFRLEGTVTVEGTNLPLAGVEVQVLIESEQQADNRIRSAKTDASGKYSVPLPQGHAWAWYIRPPAGYTPAKALDLLSFATTPDLPVVVKNYQVRPGLAWNIEVRVPEAVKPLPTIFVGFNQTRGNEYLGSHCELKGKTRDTLTVPDIGGPFTVTCGDMLRSIRAPDNMTVTADVTFRSDQIASTKATAGGVELRDKAGRSAVVQGAKVEVKDEVATIVIDVSPLPPEKFATVVGRVIDADNRPTEGAEVTIAIHSAGGSATSAFKTKTDAEGKFRLSVPQFQPKLQIALVVTKPGFAGLDTEVRALDVAKSPEVDFGSIKLRPGYSIPIRVVGPDDQPLVGAIVEPSGSYAARAQIGRTGEDGICTLRDLTAGTEVISARFGTLSAHERVPITAGPNEQLVLKLSEPRTAAAGAPAQPAVNLAIGAAAPDWEIAEWTDGQTRKLADYRGKILVLDFWGTWCGPCIQMIPAAKQLHEHYKEKDVAFLAIHTAGTDMRLVKRLMKQQEWNVATGLDKGEDIVEGRTIQAYGVQGFPTILVIDRQGKIAFNSGIEPENHESAIKEMEKLAQSIGLPWPLDKDGDNEVEKDVLNQRLTRLQFALFSREIDKALAQPDPGR
jgi:thiol-disulfide isomerase/thioredoxin